MHVTDLNGIDFDAKALDIDGVDIRIWLTPDGSLRIESTRQAQIRLLVWDKHSIELRTDDVPMTAGRLITTGEEEAQRIDDLLRRSVDELELSVRTTDCIHNANIYSIGELVQRTRADLLKIKNFGRQSLREITEILAQMGLSLGMKISEGSHRADDSLSISLESSGLRTRLVKILVNADIIYVGDLVQKTEYNLYRFPGFGRGSLAEVKAFVSRLGFSLGMEIPDWEPPSTVQLGEKEKPK